MKLKYSFECMEMEDQIIAVPINESAERFRGVIKLNDSAAEMFSLLKHETSEDEMVAALQQRYGDDAEIRCYVREFLNYLMSEGVLA